MKEYIEKYAFLWKIISVVGIAALIYVLDDFSRRSALKEAISFITLTAFLLMTVQVFVSPVGRRVAGRCSSASLLKVHKITGYVFGAVLMLHPLLLVLPRYFEAGTEPPDALCLIFSRYASPGVAAGMAAWLLLAVLVLTSVIQKRLGMDYRKWRKFHGIVSLIFVAAAACHFFLLGRHASAAFVVYGAVFVFGGSVFLLKKYFNDYMKIREADND